MSVQGVFSGVRFRKWFQGVVSGVVLFQMCVAGKVSGGFQGWFKVWFRVLFHVVISSEIQGMCQSVRFRGFMLVTGVGSGCGFRDC